MGGRSSNSAGRLSVPDFLFASQDGNQDFFWMRRGLVVLESSSGVRTLTLPDALDEDEEWEG
jgi:hypothetical protein